MAEETKNFKTQLQGTSDLISPVDVKKIIVIEIGSYHLRIGISGDNKPLLELPFIVATSLDTDTSDLTKTKLADVFGKKGVWALEEKPGEYELVYPFVKFNDENTQIIYLENYLRYVFEEILSIETPQLDILIVDSVSRSLSFKIKLIEMLFDSFKVQSVNFMNSATASLFMTGRTTGINVEIGHSSTNVVPIFEGLILNHALHSNNVGGKDASELILNSFKEKEIDLSNLKVDQIALIHDIKKSLSFCSNSYDKDISEDYKLDTQKKCFELPDGKIIELDNKTIFNSGELLLRPHIIKNTASNLTDWVFDSIGKVEPELQEKFLNNIVLSGGASLTNNLYERFRRDLYDELPKIFSKYKLNLVGDNMRPSSGWIGGSLLGSISVFQNLKIKKTTFDELTEDKERYLLKNMI